MCTLDVHPLSVHSVAQLDFAFGEQNYEKLNYENLIYAGASPSPFAFLLFSYNSSRVSHNAPPFFSFCARDFSLFPSNWISRRTRSLTIDLGYNNAMKSRPVLGFQLYSDAAAQNSNVLHIRLISL